MRSIDLQVRDLHTGVSSLKSFPSEAEAASWLAERPRFIEVLGVATPGVPAEVNGRLREALRPLDDEEKALEQRLEAVIQAVVREREEEQQKQAAAAAEAHRAAMRTADPNRPMEVHWTYDKGMSLVDPADPREITAEAREAVMAWIRERDEWVESRGQMVGDAKVTVWPGPLPAAARDERVKGGTFLPVTAPAKKT
jgi:hypothetical protein